MYRRLWLQLDAELKKVISFYLQIKLHFLLLQTMNFKLTQEAIISINEKYSKRIQELANTEWELSSNSCGCSGDCGSNWMRS